MWAFLLALSAGTVPITASAAMADIPAAKIDADVTAALDAKQMHGATVAILRGTTVIYTKAYGLRDAANNLPATVDTQYEFGSITKQFTAAGVLQLVEARKVALDAPLATYVPDAPHAKDVTIRELLNQTSGLPDYLNEADVVAAAATPATAAQILLRITGKPLDFPPGSKWEYSNTNYLLLGRVIEVASGEPYATYMRTHIFARAGLSRLATMRDEATLKTLAQGYAGMHIAPPLDDSWAMAAGNIVGTVSDLATWDAMLSSGKVVSAQDYRAMTSRQTPAGDMDYGFGFIMDQHDAQPRIWHNGGTFGFNTTDQFYPAQNLRIIVFTNEARGPADALAMRIFDDVYPQLAAEAQAAMPGEDAAVTARIKRIALDLLAGHADRPEFTASTNAFLTDSLVTQVSQQLAPLGASRSWAYKGVQMAGKTRIYTYLVQFSAATLKLTVGMEQDGKLNSISFTQP